MNSTEKAPAQSHRLEDLNTVETSVETWLDFCNAGMQSDFYKIVKKHTKNSEMAAAMTLLRNYLEIFSPLERIRLESDVEYFYKYAKGFINELAPYRYHETGYDPFIRAAFMGKIKSLLHHQKGESEIDKERYVFIRTIVRFCSSLDYIIQVHDQYKSFLFRDLPVIRNSQYFKSL